MIEHLFMPAITWYMQHLNYWTVTLFMAIESSFLPLPSEVVVPPAAWKAAQGELNIYLVIVAGTVGSIIGAACNYLLALTLGRKIIYAIVDTRLAHAFLINREKMEKSEVFYLRYGRSSTFIGRLVPVVRHLISIPAGFTKMRFSDFVLYTFLGSLIWNAILAAFGYFLYSQKELLNTYFKQLSFGLLAVGVIFVIYVIIKSTRKKKQAKTVMLPEIK
jgi:membrane protein DedA with SNARE-associated domain